MPLTWLAVGASPETVDRRRPFGSPFAANAKRCANTTVMDSVGDKLCFILEKNDGKMSKIHGEYKIELQ